MSLTSDGFEQSGVKSALRFFRDRGYFHSCVGSRSSDSFVAQLDWIKAKVPDDYFDNRLTTQLTSQMKVYVSNPGLLSTTVVGMLGDAGFQICRDALPQAGSTDVICLHVTDWDDHNSALSYNRSIIPLRVPTLYAAICETSARVGPFVLAGETACYECFHHRMRSSKTFVDEFDRRVGINIAGILSAVSLDAGPSPLYASVVASLVVVELQKYARKLTPLSLLGRILDIDLLRYQIDLGRVLRLPRCHACGSGRAHNTPTLAVRDLM